MVVSSSYHCDNMRQVAIVFILYERTNADASDQGLKNDADWRIILKSRLLRFRLV